MHIDDQELRSRIHRLLENLKTGGRIGAAKCALTAGAVVGGCQPEPDCCYLADAAYGVPDGESFDGWTNDAAYMAPDTGPLDVLPVPDAAYMAPDAGSGD